MKCIAAVVLVVLAVAEASYIPYAHHGYAVAPVVTYAANHYGPTVVQSNDYLRYGHAYNHYGAHHIPAAVTYDNGLYHGDYHHNYHHSAAVIAAPVHHEATYTAATRGSVHKAPLAGHIVNQKSLNLAAAPGTW